MTAGDQRPAGVMVMCQEISAKMLELVKPCCILGGRALPIFERYADRNGCEEMWRYFEHCLDTQKSTGDWWEKKGNTPFEDVREEMEALYRQHPARGAPPVA